MTCRFCVRLEEDCECVFYCSDCDARGVETVMVKDEINGGHLCPECDAAPHHPGWAGNVLDGSDVERNEWSRETWRVKSEQAGGEQ